MRKIPSNATSTEFQGMIARVLSEREPALVATSSGDKVVVMQEQDFLSWQETAYLLRSPPNAERLGRSLAEAQTGNLAEHTLVDP